MISVEEAKRLLMQHAPVCPARTCALADAHLHALAQEVTAPYDHPLFDCSAVDGYAFAHDPQRSAYTIAGNIPAGSVLDHPLKPGECARIFTGAALPPGADTVVMQEFCTVSGTDMQHADAKLRRGGNVRSRGEQVRAGEMVLEDGTVLDAAAIGLLASTGVRSVTVAQRPRVSVVITGDEFARTDPPEPGRIFNSNDVMLASALREQGFSPTVLRAADDPAQLRNVIEDALRNSDLVLTTGGASVGDHDLVGPVLRDLHADVHFHTVAQKPGKPMLFATCQGKPIIGLPGNPRAVLVLFHEYVRPFLRAMQGALGPWTPRTPLPMHHEVVLKGDRAEFRAALVHEGRVFLLHDEGSHMLRSLVGATVIAYFPASVRALRAGDPVEVHFL
ncbi:MAG TPA: gephyrin-like molybdotransferase Glp [Flavobacteriales bacterium]|nr:gephyrin-like molybdotransferase Glp [Flavobacteriales bacterium]